MLAGSWRLALAFRTGSHELEIRRVRLSHMKALNFWELGHISEQDLRSGLSALLANGYRAEARIIAHIAEVGQRKLHLKDGSPSLFDYCLTQLGLSNGETFHRMTAAAIARRFPVVFSLIERRQIHLTAVCLLRDYLTPENHLELLAEASGKTKFQVQELLARRFPRPDVSSRIRKLPTHNNQAETAQPENAQPAKQASTLIPPATSIPAVPPGTAPSTTTAPDIAPAPAPARVVGAPTRVQTPVPAPITPTSAARYRIQLNASSTLKEKLDLFQALVSHSIPNGDIAAVLESALDLALKHVQKQRFATTERPRSRHSRGLKRTAQHREHIPNAVRREVAARDELRCTYVSENGCRCPARTLLQIHHEAPWARGGASTVENLRLLCAAHNRLLAERDFGARYVAARQAARDAAAHIRDGTATQERARRARQPVVTGG
jgi:5-methylcytosine-specific restriction endonuclease McrA